MLFSRLSQRIQDFKHNSIIGQIVQHGLEKIEEKIEAKLAPENVAAEANSVAQDIESALQEESANIPTAETIEPYSASGLNALAGYARGSRLLSGIRNVLSQSVYGNSAPHQSNEPSWAEGGRAELTDDEKNQLWEQVSEFCKSQNYNPTETQIVYRTQLDSMSRQKKKNMEQSQAVATRKAAEKADADARQAEYFPHYQWYVMEMFLARDEKGDYIMGNTNNKDTMNNNGTYGFIDFEIFSNYCSYNAGSGYTYTPNYQKTNSVYESGGRVFMGQNIRASFDDYFLEKFKDYKTMYDTPTYTEEELEKVMTEALERIDGMDEHMYWCHISTLCVALGLSDYFSADNSTFEYTHTNGKTYKFSKYTCYQG